MSIVLFPERSAAASLRDSERYCERLARRQAGNFYPAFRLLPTDQRRAMCALYAFSRIADDLADEPADRADKCRAIDDWRHQLEAALDGEYEHPIHPALHAAVKQFAIPTEYLEAVLDGVAMDLDTTRYETFVDLYRYCYRVASAVGLSCIRIWRCEDDRGAALAESAGIAFQLTNILRDLGEDAARGRVYLPQEDLARFGYDERRLRRGVRDGAFRELMRFEIARARDFYNASAELADLLPPPGRAIFLTLWRTYRGLLDAIERRDYDVFSGRVRLSRWRKVWLVARALPVRWGWI